MTVRISSLRPGLLVALNTSVKGGVSYFKRELEDRHVDEDGAERERWETERTVVDPREHEKAGVVRSKARQLIARVCVPSAFGLLCPADRAEKLNAAITEAVTMANEFNRTASVTRVGVYAMVGEFAQDDARAIRSINAELAELVETMETGLRELDVEKVRDAAKRAKPLAQMLTPAANEKIEQAVAQARDYARKIVKAGESAAIEIDQAVLNNLRTTRGAFLDLSEAAAVEAPAPVGAALDLGEAGSFSYGPQTPVAPAVPRLDLM